LSVIPQKSFTHVFRARFVRLPKIRYSRGRNLSVVPAGMKINLMLRRAASVLTSASRCAENTSQTQRSLCPAGRVARNDFEYCIAFVLSHQPKG
jgi:hypothetical protein